MAQPLKHPQSESELFNHLIMAVLLLLEHRITASYSDNSAYVHVKCKATDRPIAHLAGHDINAVGYSQQTNMALLLSMSHVVPSPHYRTERK